jgi:hypothetical protein
LAFRRQAIRLRRSFPQQHVKIPPASVRLVQVTTSRPHSPAAPAVVLDRPIDALPAINRFRAYANDVEGPTIECREPAMAGRRTNGAAAMPADPAARPMLTACCFEGHAFPMSTTAGCSCLQPASADILASSSEGHARET